jgi:hypothetical protein
MCSCQEELKLFVRILKRGESGQVLQETRMGHSACQTVGQYGYNGVIILCSRYAQRMRLY